MIEEHYYKHKEFLYGENALFLYREGTLRRITNNPQDFPKDGAHISEINEKDWIDTDLEKREEEGWELVIRKGTAFQRIFSTDFEFYQKTLLNLQSLVEGELVKHNTNSETKISKNQLLPAFTNLIQIKIHTDKHLKGMVEVESNPYGILYSSPWESHHGMQCNFIGGTPEYNKLFELCSQIEKAAREIHKLYEENGK